MAIMTPENLLKNLDNSLKSVIIFDEKITIATDNGNAIMLNENNFQMLLACFKNDEIK